MLASPAVKSAMVFLADVGDAGARQQACLADGDDVLLVWMTGIAGGFIRDRMRG